MSFDLGSELLNYIAEHGSPPGRRLPPIDELASVLGVSTSKLREQLEVARTLGLVEVRPKTGIRTLDFSFLPCLRTSLKFALAVAPERFENFGVLRNHLEVGFWHEAVRELRHEDKIHLKNLVDRAWEQLRGTPVQIPHSEHRELHMTIFSRLNNPFVCSLLEAYWEAYEIVGLNVYTDYSYLEAAWRYHEKMVESVLNNDYDAGYQALVEHIGILQDRPEMDRFRPEGVREIGAPQVDEV
ncbi:MAG: FCD domain-containing protein [Anaerolineales bacterium]|nr:FCD domain-containing protein [Anaerolineales bacterium]